MKIISDFIYGYGESNSLAFEAFVCLRTAGTILQLKSLTTGLFQASIADFQEPHKYLKVALLLTALKKNLKCWIFPCRN